MLTKSEAIILRKTPFSENSAVLSIFTRQYGILSFLVPGFHGKSGKAALLQPGNLLEIVYYYQANKNLKRIKEMRPMGGFQGYNYGPVQLQTMLFCLEILQKSLPEEQEDPGSFEFALEQLKELSITQQFTWFPLTFLLKFIEITGLAPQWPEQHESGYWVMEAGGSHSHLKPQQALTYLEKNEIDACKSISTAEIPAIDKQERRLLTEKLLHYLRYHLFPEKELRSYPILLELLE